MKILQVNKYYYLRGGAEKYMLETSNWLSKEQHEVIPFAMHHESNVGTPYDRYFVSNVETEHVRFGMHTFKVLGRMMYSLEARRNMATLLVEQKPDLAHIHNIYTQISPSILDTLKDRRVPMVMTVHDHHLISPQYNIWAEGCGEDCRDIGIIKGTHSRFHKHSYAASLAQVLTYKIHRWLRMYEKNIDLFICPSQYLKRQMVHGGFPKEKIVVNPYGVDARLIKPHFKHDGYMLFVGRLSDEKGVDTIIKAAQMIPEVTFKIAGRGPAMEYLHRLAIGTDNVEFLGFRAGAELDTLYQGATAVLLPSRVHENFPLIILEAMAHGKPVIASDVGGVPEIVEDRTTGMLVKPTDLNAWIEAILRLYYDDDLQRMMSINARQSVERKFTIDDHRRRLMNNYQRVTE